MNPERFLQTDKVVYFNDKNYHSKIKQLQAEDEIDFRSFDDYSYLDVLADDICLPPDPTLQNAQPTLSIPQIPVVTRRDEAAEKQERTRACFQHILKIFESEYIENCQALYPDYNISAVIVMVLYDTVEFVKRRLLEKLADRSMIENVKFVETEELVEELQAGECVPGSGIVATRRSYEDRINGRMRRHNELKCDVIGEEDLVSAVFKDIGRSTISAYARDKDDNLYMLTVAHSHIKQWTPGPGGDTNASDYHYDIKKRNLPLRNSHMFLYEPKCLRKKYRVLCFEHVSLFGTYTMNEKPVLVDVCAIKIPQDIENDIQMSFMNTSDTDLYLKESIVDTYPHNVQTYGSTSGRQDMTIHASDIHLLALGKRGPLYASSPALKKGDSGCSYISLFDTSKSHIVEVYSMHRSISPKILLTPQNDLPTSVSLSYPIGNQLYVLEHYGGLKLTLAPLYVPNLPLFK